MLASIVINTLTSCIELHSTEQEEKPAETDLWKQAYEEVIRQSYTECDTTKPNEYKHYGRYGLYDFDQDDAPELFLEVYEPDCYIHVYDFDNGSLLYLDMIGSEHAWVYGVNEPNAVLYGYTGNGGVQGWSMLRYENGEFQFEHLATFCPYESPWGGPEEDPLPEMGYAAALIEYYNLDDLSGLGIYSSSMKGSGEENE